jgi:two-component system sensor histidine kinase/response regulator
MTKPHILIAEDENIVALHLQSALEVLGYHVPVIVASGEKAVEEAEKARPDLVLMDIMLEGDVDGVEAARQIRDRVNIPVVYLTAYADDDTLLRARITRPFGYLVKPFDERELHTTIQTALHIHQIEQEREEIIEELGAFAHTVAHELKNSLSEIVVFAGLLRGHSAALPEKARGYVRSIAETGHRICNTIDNLLLLATVREVEEVNVEPLDMAPILAEVRTRLEGMIEKYEANIALPETWPVAAGYGPWVEEVWINCLSNALEYGGRPPRVELGATEQANDVVRFWVRDNGPGLTSEEQSRLFTPFTRLDPKGGEGRAKGHGLGLSIVRRIVERLGGQVRVESEVGQGSIFYFTLPTTARAAKTDDKSRTNVAQIWTV